MGMSWLLGEPVPADVQAVLDAAAVLDITEFQVFELAHREWFGRPAPTRTIERWFAAYMFEAAVPPWVRQFTRRVLAQRQDQCQSAGPGREGSPARIKGGVYLALLALALWVLIAAAGAAGHLLPFLDQCYFPPCY
ncbi:MAG: hypothetical protein P8076_10425 [Gammaproteobacteria bacterium]